MRGRRRIQRQMQTQPIMMRCLSCSSLPTRDPFLLPLLLSLLFVTSFASLTFDYRASKCNKAFNYTDGSRYSSNLDTLLNFLIQNGSRSGFNTSSYGQSPNKAYGFIQCIGNISARDCSSCSHQAKSRLQLFCPNDVGGEVWMTYCYLRYDNSTFVSKLDTDGQYLTNVNKVSNGAEAFKSIKFELLSNLSKTVFKPASEGFAIGSATYSVSSTVYGLVQCWRDISVGDCKRCLISAIQGVESCCSTSQGAQAMLGSCTVRYEIYPFYEPAESPSAPSPSSLPKGSPPPNSSAAADASANGTLPLSKPNKKSSKTLPIILGTLGGVILVIVICLFALKRKLKSAIFGKPVTVVTHHKERHDYSAEKGLLSEEHKIFFSL